MNAEVSHFSSARYITDPSTLKRAIHRLPLYSLLSRPDYLNPTSKRQTQKIEHHGFPFQI